MITVGAAAKSCSRAEGGSSSLSPGSLGVRDGGATVKEDDH